MSKKVKNDNNVKKLEDIPEILSEEISLQKNDSKKKKLKIKRKSKISKDEKNKIKIKKQIDVLIKDPTKYQSFFDKIDYWMLKNYRKLEVFFQRLDENDSGYVNADIFTSGLKDLDCPLIEIEFKLLLHLIDPEEKEKIAYTGFQKGLTHYLNFSTQEQYKEIDTKKNDYFPDVYRMSVLYHNTSINDPFIDKTERFVKIDMRLAIFNHYPQHPCHTTIDVHTSIQINELCKMVTEVTHINTGQMNIYTNCNCDKSEMLPLNSTLDACGIKGGSRESPVHVILFYDFTVNFTDCMLLNCDHYFQRDEVINPVLRAYIKD